MTSITLEKAFELLTELQEMSDALNSISKEFSETPELMSIYSTSFLYRFDQTRRRLVEELFSTDTGNVDLWLRLQGTAIGHGYGQMDVVARFMKRFKTTAGHAVGALQRVPHKGGRFTSGIESATAYQLTATIPGSLKFGLAMPEPAEVSAPSDLTLFKEAELKRMNTQIDSVISNVLLGEQAIQVIDLTLRSADDEDAFDELHELVSAHGVLRMCHHVKSLFPAGVESVGFESDLLIGGGQEFTSDVKRRLTERASAFYEEEQYVTGVGRVYRIDWANNTMNFDSVRMPEFVGLDKISVNYDESSFNVKEFGNNLVSFGGFMSFDKKGVPKKIDLDYIEMLEPSEEEVEL